MSQPTFGLCFDSKMDDIIPDDSISRGGISNQSGNYQDGKVSFMTAMTLKTTKAKKFDERPERSSLIFVKDDKHESNIDYLKGLMGVF
jgi:hypothetical protein